MANDVRKVSTAFTNTLKEICGDLVSSILIRREFLVKHGKRFLAALVAGVFFVALCNRMIWVWSLARAWRHVGVATPLKPVVVQSYGVQFLENGIHLVAEVDGRVLYIKGTPEHINLVTSPNLVPVKTKQQGSVEEMAVPGHPKEPAKLHPAIVKIVAGGTIVGLGTRIGNRLVTSRHVLKGITGHKVFLVANEKETPLLKEWPCSLDGGSDLDVVGVDVPSGIWALLKVKAAKLARPRSGDVISVHGHNDFNVACVSYGTIKPSNKLFLFRHTASTKRGDSGSPIVTGSGKVVGVHCRALSTGQAVNEAVCLDFLIGIEASDTSSAAASQELFRERYQDDDAEVRYQRKLDKDESDVRMDSEANDGLSDNLPSAMRGPTYRIFLGENSAVYSSNDAGNAYHKIHEKSYFKGNSWADLEDEFEEDVHDDRYESGLNSTIPPLVQDTVKAPPPIQAVEPLQNPLVLETKFPDFDSSQKQVLAVSSKSCTASESSTGPLQLSPEVASDSPGVAQATPSMEVLRPRRRNRKRSTTLRRAPTPPRKTTFSTPLVETGKTVTPKSILKNPQAAKLRESKS